MSRSRPPSPRRSPWAGAETRPSESGASPAGMLQINIRTDAEVIERFRRLCHEDRRVYGDMLRILLDAYETRGG